ncbi:MAG TPA: cyclic pyranopterin monophosphate synthase MoaC [Tepidiformaceae bacterium]|nr:cyclic pyranopterin monophosphate synthase MoaC [Tepidiformaceae bacterium]
MTEPALSHLDARGAARMVDVSAKPFTQREAIAEASVAMQPATLAIIQDGGIPKGDVFAVARVAGIMAAKQTSTLIPMCHPLPITAVEVAIDPEGDSHVRITATVRTTSQTGVEMEALTAASVAALTVYDMCKAVDRGMVVEHVRLLEKRGGESGEWLAADHANRA